MCKEGVLSYGRHAFFLRLFSATPCEKYPFGVYGVDSSLYYFLCAIFGYKNSFTKMEQYGMMYKGD